jgi:peroxiredoxin (alkyl hydroperoxide reductase subunit C)
MAAPGESVATGGRIAVGDVAPDLSLPDSSRNLVSLNDFRSQRAVLLVFYPFAFSGICTGELSQVRDHLDDFQNDRVQILAISTDPTYTLRAWAAAEGYGFPLLSDFWPHGKAANTYGVFNESAGMAIRGTFLVDIDGIVRFAEANPPGQPRDQDQWRRVIAALPAP